MTLCSVTVMLLHHLVGLDKLVRDAEGIRTVEERERLIDPLSLEDKVRSISPSLALTICAFIVIPHQEEDSTEVLPLLVEMTSETKFGSLYA